MIMDCICSTCPCAQEQKCDSVKERERLQRKLERIKELVRFSRGDGGMVADPYGLFLDRGLVLLVIDEK
jgi:hypothetical protein